MTTTASHMVTEEICDPVHHDKGTVPGEGKRMFMKYLEATVRYEASDLHVKVDSPPRIRIRSALKNLQTEESSEQLMFQIAKDVLDEKQYEHFHHHGAIDFAYDYDDDHRFRFPTPSSARQTRTSSV